MNFGDSIRNTFMCKVNSTDTGDSNGWDSGEAVDERCESLKGFDGFAIDSFSVTMLDEVVAGFCRLISRLVMSTRVCVIDIG